MAVTSSNTMPAPVVAPPSKRRLSGTLVVTAVNPRERPPGPVAEIGGCRGVLTVGRCIVEATDGQLLGLAAWVLDAGGIDINLSTVKDHSYRVESKAPFQSATIHRRRASNSLPVRDEAWFLLRFAKALYGAHLARTGPLAALDGSAKCDLAHALALVPEQFQVNTHPPRVATLAPSDLPVPSPQPLLKAPPTKPKGVWTRRQG